jgi:nickel-dependent lactate racemase
LTISTKKLRYMSKIAAILVASDNTRLNCTQPIANLLISFL